MSLLAYLAKMGISEKLALFPQDGLPPEWREGMRVALSCLVDGKIRVVLMDGPETPVKDGAIAIMTRAYIRYLLGQPKATNLDAGYITPTSIYSIDIDAPKERDLYVVNGFSLSSKKDNEALKGLLAKIVRMENCKLIISTVSEEEFKSKFGEELWNYMAYETMMVRCYSDPMIVRVA